MAVIVVICSKFSFFLNFILSHHRLISAKDFVEKKEEEKDRDVERGKVSIKVRSPSDSSMTKNEKTILNSKELKSSKRYSASVPLSRTPPHALPLSILSKNSPPQTLPLSAVHATLYDFNRR